MIITVHVSRTGSQLIRASARVWTVDGRGGLMRTVTWDPSGPLSALHALDQALEALYHASDREADNEALEGF